MSRKSLVVYECDRCKKTMQAVVSVTVQIGWQQGAVSQEAHEIEIDLCTECASVALQKTVNPMPSFEDARAWADMVTTK